MQVPPRRERIPDACLPTAVVQNSATRETWKKERMESLRVTLREALEFNRQDALCAAGKDFQEQPIAIGSEVRSSSIFVHTVAGFSERGVAIPGGTIRN
jgi:hypothetical protein